MKAVTTIGVSAAVALLAGSAFAQGVGVDASGSVGTTDPATAQATSVSEPAVPPPAPEPAPAPAPDATVQANSGNGVGVGLPSAEPVGDSDHSQVVGRLAVGYMGTQTMPLGAGTVTAPVIGARYWISNMLGIDAGLGFLWSTGSVEGPGGSVDKADVTAFILHGGVPLSLADSGHFSFQIIPEMNIGFAGTGDSDAAPNVENTTSGFLFNIGARAGGEIQFGFMGIPQLSLTGSVGLFLNHTSAGQEVNTDGNVVETTDSNTSLGTTLGPDPWDLFTGNISALYYF
jgi:hypothetical protein